MADLRLLYHDLIRYETELWVTGAGRSGTKLLDAPCDLPRAGKPMNPRRSSHRMLRDHVPEVSTTRDGGA